MSKSPFLLSLLLLLAVPLRAQIHSAAFDPNCYLPSENDRSQTMVRYGTKKYQFLGQGMANYGAAPGQSYARVFFAGLPESPVFLAAVATGPDFNLKSPEIVGLTKLPVNPEQYWYPIRKGHFHTKDRWDILMENDNWFRIYWADADGNYDSSQYTALEPFVPDTLPFGSGRGFNGDPYATYFSSDTVEDIIMVGDVCSATAGCDFRVYLYKGGDQLFRKRERRNYEDTSVSLLNVPYSFERPGAVSIGVAQGHFSGSEHEDLVAIGDSEIFFYRNTGTGSLADVAHALRYDTIATFDPGKKSYPGNYPSSQFAISAVKRSPSDPTQDLVLAYPTTDSSDGAIRIFKGGPDFGKSRIDLDRPDFLLMHPSRYDWSMHITYLFDFVDAGDMSGTGDHVLYCDAGDNNDLGLHFFYVLGDAIDDKIDMAVILPLSAAYVDTLTVNRDNKQDFIMGMDFVTDPLNEKNLYAGMIEVIYGTDKIPVRSHRGVSEQRLSHDAAAVVYPNPARSGETLHAILPKAGEWSCTVHNVLGQEVFRSELNAVVDGAANGAVDQAASDEAAETRLTIPEALAPGLYTIEFISEGSRTKAQFIVRR